VVWVDQPQTHKSLRFFVSDRVREGHELPLGEGPPADALGGTFPDSEWQDLGPQPLKGLTAPIHLYQVLPAAQGGGARPSGVSG